MGRLLRLELSREGSHYNNGQRNNERIEAKSERKDGKKHKNDYQSGERNKISKKVRAAVNTIKKSKFPHYATYTIFKTLIDHMFAVNQRRMTFKKPQPLKKDKSKRNPKKYCWLHQDSYKAMSSEKNSKPMMTMKNLATKKG